jgi:tetratricopeptide (TPR) repeat protein
METVEAKKTMVSLRASSGSKVLKITLSLCLLLGCLYGFWFAARDGITLLLANYAVIADVPVAAEEAIRFNSSEPEAHYARATLLKYKGELPEAIRELEIAASLRPHDYVLWQELASARDQAGDAEGALRASRVAVSLAPYYAEPRWQLGNLLFRSDRRDEGLAELSRAVESDPSLTLSLVDLAWNASGGDAEAVIKLINPQTSARRLKLAQFFAKAGKATEAIELFRASGDSSETDRRDLMAALLTQKKFPEAHEVWASLQNNTTPVSNGIAFINNSGFEEEIVLDDLGFNWHLARDLGTVRFVKDGKELRQGSYSLRIEYHGDPGKDQIISQLILVESNTRYHLNFAARTEEVASSALPVMAISDAASSNASILGTSSPLPRGNSGWQDYSIEFTTKGATTAIRLGLQHQNCPDVSCPIFGRIWLDDFSLRKL